VTSIRRTEPYSALAVGALIIVGLMAGALSLPIQAVVILGTAAVVAYVAWLWTTYRHPVRSRRVIATYLAAVAFQILHLAEEHFFGFPHQFTELFNSPTEWTESSFLLVFVFGAGALWVLAGAGALYQVRVANYFIWFYALGAGLINAIAHFIFPLLAGGYFPGLYTAGGHLVFSGLLLYFLVVESRQAGRGSAADHRVGDAPARTQAIDRLGRR
jgi:hypothetical protein